MIEEIDKHRWRAKEEKDLPTLRYNNYNYVKALISNKPQSVVKVIGYREGAKETRNTLEYIARAGKEDELELEDENGLKIKGKDAIAGLVNEWAEDFDEINEDSKRKNRDSTHMMLSADIEPNEKNKEILENVAREFLRREFFDKGFSYTFVAHIDTQHPHIHVVIKNRPIMMEIKKGVWKNRKLELNPNDLEHLREQFAIEMQKNGLEQVVTLRKDDPNKHLEDIRKRLFGDKFKNYKGIKEKIEWYQAKLQEKDWKFEDKNIRQYSAYLQMELMRVKEQIKKSRISISEKTKLNIEHRELMKALDLARKNQEAEQLKQMVQNFKDKTLDKVEQYQKRNMTLVELLEKNIESYQSVKKEAGLKIEEKLIKIKEKLQSDFPSLSVKDAQYLGIDTSNLTTFSKRIEYKEKVLVSDVEDSNEVYEEIDKSYDADFIDLKSLDFSNININQETSKLREEILVRQKTNLISRTIEPLKEYLKQNKSDLTENKYKFLENRLIKIKDKLTGDFTSLSVKDAEFIGIDTSNLTTYEKEIKYKDKILASDLKTREEFIVREVGIEIRASDLLTKKEFVVEEIEKTSIVENIDLVNLNLKDIQFKESKIEEAIKISQISRTIEPLKEYLKQNKSDLTENKYKFLENRLIKIKDKLTGDFTSLSVKDAEFIGIDTSNLTTYEKEIKYKDKILASDLKTREEFIVREVGIEIRASDLLTKKEFVVEEIEKTSIVENIDLVNLNLKDIQFKESKIEEAIKISQISRTIEPLKEYLKQNKSDLTENKYKFLENRLIKIKDKLTGDFTSLSVKDAEFIGIDTSNLTTYEKEIKYKDKILASDLKTREEFIVREVGIEIRASDLLTKKEFVVEEIEKTSIVENIDLVNLNLKDIQFKESKIEEAIKISQISRTIEPLKEYLKQNKSDLTENKYKFLENRLIKIKDKLTGDFTSLSVKDAEFIGIDTSNLTTYEKEIKYKDKILASDLKTREEFIVREVGIEIRASDLLTKKEFVVEEIEKTSIVENIDLVNLNLKDIQFKESKIEEAIKISQISRTIEPLKEYLKQNKSDLTENKYKFLENRLIKIKDKLTGDFTSLSVKDAEFIGIDTSNLTTYEKEIKYKDKILASDLKTREEFIVREVGIEIRASDLLTKKEFVVEEIEKTSIVENIDLVNLNLKDIQFKESKIEEAIKISQKVKAISESINPFKNSLENQKDKISIEHYNKLEKRILNIKKSLEKDFPSLSVKDAEYLGINTDNLPKLEKVDITKEDGSTYTIHNIDLNKLDILALNENIERIVTKETEIVKDEKTIEQEITNLNNELVPGRERVNISSNEIENLKQMTLNELKITNPKPVLDALGISYKEQYGRLTFKTHAERTASSNMYLDKAGVWKYKNFSTGAGGTVENVIMDITGMQYKEALKYATTTLGTRNYLDERFEDVKYENSILKEEHLEKIKKLKEANINYQKESSSESKVVKIEEIYSTDKEIMEFLSKRGIENIADGFYKITGQYEVNGKTFYNTGIGVLTNEHNIDSNLEEVGADIHLLKPITLKNGNVLKTMSFGNKDITVINNKDINNKIAIFESKMDYAAACSQDIEKFENTTSIIANGTGNYFKIIQELEKLNAKEKEVLIYNQNDKAGDIFVTQILAQSKINKFDFIKYSPGEDGKDINDLIKNKVNIEERFLKDNSLIDFISNSKHKDDLEKVLNENIKIELKENNLIEETNLIFDKDDESGFSKSITIERNAENFRKIISEKEEILKDEYKLQRLDEIKRYINKTNPSLSISDAQFLGIDVSEFQKTTKEIPYKVFDFSSSEAMKKEFKEFSNSFPKFAKDMLNEAIDKQEISFEKLSYIGIKPTQFKNLTNNDFENEKADLTNNKELLKEFQKLEKDFPELAKDELNKSVKKNNITTGRLAKYGMNPESFINYNENQISPETIEIDFIDFENNNIYKKDFILKIDYENKNKEINQNLNIQSFKNSINKTIISEDLRLKNNIKIVNVNLKDSIKLSSFKNNITRSTISKNIGLKDITKIEDINFKDSIKAPLEEIKNVNLKTFQTVPNDFFKEKDLNLIKEDDLNLYNLKHLKALENSEIGYFTVKSTSSKMLQAQAGLTSLLSQANAIEKSFDEVDKSKVSIIEKIDHKKILKNLKKDFIENIAKLSKDAEVILDNSLLIQKNKDVEFENKYINEGLKNFSDNPKKLDDAYVKECKKQNNFNIDYEEFKKVFLKNELKEDKKSLNTTLENYKYTLEKSLKVINKELGIFDRAKSSVVIKEQLKKIDKVLSKGIEF